jgi:hypothetical protein
MLLKVSDIKWLGNHRLRVRFTDGSSGEHDFADMVAEPGELLEPLRDPAYFSRVFLEFGAPTWPNGFDIAPEWLRREMSIANELSSSPIQTKRTSPIATHYYVVPNKEGGWAVKRAGSSRSSAVFESQSKAIAWARELARNKNSELTIYAKDGRIRNQTTYGLAVSRKRKARKSSSGVRGQKRA